MFPRKTGSPPRKLELALFAPEWVEGNPERANIPLGPGTPSLSRGGGGETVGVEAADCPQSHHCVTGELRALYEPEVKP